MTTTGISPFLGTKAKWLLAPQNSSLCWEEQNFHLEFFSSQVLAKISGESPLRFPPSLLPPRRAKPQPWAPSLARVHLDLEILLMPLCCFPLLSSFSTSNALLSLSKAAYLEGIFCGIQSTSAKEKAVLTELIAHSLQHAFSQCHQLHCGSCPELKRLVIRI